MKNLFSKTNNRIRLRSDILWTQSDLINNRKYTIAIEDFYTGYF